MELIYNFNDLVVFCLLVSLEVVGEGLGVVGNLGALGSAEVVTHTLVVGEERSGCADFSTHIANSSHTSAAEGLDTRTSILDDGTSSTLDSENTSNLEDNILRGGPASNLASEVNTNNLGALEFPRNSSHDVDSISTTNTASNHSETTSVGSMRVGTDHQTTGESVVFEDNLMDDTRTGFPETKTVLGGCGGQKVVDFPVDVNGTGQILNTADLSLDEMVAVDSGGDGSGVHTSGHELEEGHLGNKLH